MTSHKSAPQIFAPAARVYRGDGVEAVHAAAIAVVDADSRLTHFLGDPWQAFFSRSSIKPLQALPLVEAGGLEHFGFGVRELALCAASHSGTEGHRAIVLGMLHKLGLDAAALQCGSAVPLGLALTGVGSGQSALVDSLSHNCSGKHSGFLALAKLLQQPLDTYLEPSGAVQRAVRQAVADACEVEVGSLVVGMDGCSAPNYALPLVNLAVGFKNLALAKGATPTAAARKQVRDAMLAHPVLVSGEGRLDYDLSTAFAGRAVVKGGAEALLLLAFTEPALGIAIKVLDGGSRALEPILVETLKQLGLIDDLARFPSLQRYERPSIANARQLKTGEVRAELVLERP
jgi:L-asparaginase II